MKNCPNCGDPIDETKWGEGGEICPHCTMPLKEGAAEKVAAQGEGFSGLGSTVKEIICPNSNCGYRGTPKCKAKGSRAVGCLLMLFFILPGLIYFALMGGYKYTCPKCGIEISSD